MAATTKGFISRPELWTKEQVESETGMPYTENWWEGYSIEGDPSTAPIGGFPAPAPTPSPAQPKAATSPAAAAPPAPTSSAPTASPNPSTGIGGNQSTTPVGGYSWYGTPMTGWWGMGAASGAENNPDIQLGDWLQRHFGELQVPYTWTTPSGEEALGKFRGLQTQSADILSSLMGSIAADPQAGRDAYADVLYEHAKEPIIRDATDLFQQLNESTFGRGMGMSTVSSDNIQRWGRELQSALGRAGRESYLAAGDEQRADLATWLAGLGQAFGMGTEGLGLEANIGLTNTGRWQEAATHGLDLAFQEYLNRIGMSQQESQFVRSLASQETLARLGIDANLSLADKQMALQERLQTMGLSQQDAQFYASLAFQQQQASTQANQFAQQLALTKQLQEQGMSLQDAQFWASLAFQQNQSAVQQNQFQQQIALTQRLQELGLSQQDAHFWATLNLQKDTLAQQLELAKEQGELSSASGLAALLSVVFGPAAQNLGTQGIQEVINWIRETFGSAAVPA